MANITKYKTTINGVSTVYDIKDSNAIPKSGGNVVTGNICPTTSGTISLGDSTHKWSKINGVDPGALGMPSDNRVDITSLFFENSTWTVPSDGWVSYLYYSTGTGARGYFYYTNNINIPICNNYSSNNMKGCFTLIPFKKGSILKKLDSASSGYVKVCFFPCIGNV